MPHITAYKFPEFEADIEYRGIVPSMHILLGVKGIYGITTQKSAWRLPATKSFCGVLLSLADP